MDSHSIPRSFSQSPGWQAQAWVLLLGAGALLFVVLASHAAWVETPTVDEFAHLPAGVASWDQGRLDLYSKNPPLVRLWNALPVALDPAVTVPVVRESAFGWGPWQYGQRFMEANAESYLGHFFRARLMNIALGLGCGLLLFVWARQLVGRTGAAVVTTLFWLSPTVLAHAHLATLDMGAALSILLALFSLRWALGKPAPWRFVVAGALLGVALLTKFTAILIVPAAILFVFLFRWWQKAERSTWWLRLAGQDSAQLLITALFVVNLGMGFGGSFQALGYLELQSSFGQGLKDLLPEWLPIPLPTDYVQGFDAQKLDLEQGEFGSYLRGRWSQQGWWYYNLVALGVKTPEPILLLLLGAPLVWRRQRAPREMWLILLPLLLMVIFLSAFNRINIGIRYLLPVFPLLFLLIAPWFSRHTPRRLRLTLVPLLLVFVVINVAGTHPGYLSYFNTLAGGPDRGEEWLLDSNLDWGQDLYRLPVFLAEEDIRDPIWLLYFGHVDPGIYGIRYRLLPAEPVQGVVVASVNYVRGAEYIAFHAGGRPAPIYRQHLQWLQGTEPVARLGSLLVFDTRPRDAP